MPFAVPFHSKAASLKLDEHKHVRRDYELAKQVSCRMRDGLRAWMGVVFCQGLPGCEGFGLTTLLAQADKVWSDLASRLAIVEMDCEKAIGYTGNCTAYRLAPINLSTL